MQRYFALVFRSSLMGYALDYYPNEKRACEWEFRGHIVGDFATHEEAQECVRQTLKAFAEGRRSRA